MAKIAACTGCAVKSASCDFAKDLLNRLRGLSVSLVRHRCAVRVPL